MKKVTIILLLLGIACGSNDTSQKIQFWSFGGVPTHMEWTKKRVASFNESHPDITVIQGQKSWNMIRELLYTTFSTGTGPDVMRVHANYAAEFGEAGHFYPINKFADFEQVKAIYLPNLMQATMYKNNCYGLPGLAIAFVLCCNTELFDEAGLTPPKTWTEFRNAAKKLTKDTDDDGTIDQWGLTLQGGDKGGFAYRLAPFFLKAGVDILSDDLKTVTFDHPRSIETIRLFADMHQKDHSITPGFLAYTLSEINDLFCSNKVAMSIEGPWFPIMVEEKKPGKEFYTVPVPVPDDMIDSYETAPTLQDMVMIAMSAHSKHPDAAWEFVKYLRNEEADMAWRDPHMGGIPTTIKTLDSTDPSEFADIDVYKNELKHAKPWPAHPQMIAIVRNIIAPYGMKGIAGDLTPEDAIAQAAEEAQAVLDGAR